MWPVMFLGSMSFEQAVREFFPWANVDVDEELYDEAEEERWIEENGMRDPEDGVYLYDSTHLAELFHLGSPNLYPRLPSSTQTLR